MKHFYCEPESEMVMKMLKEIDNYDEMLNILYEEAENIAFYHIDNTTEVKNGFARVRTINNIKEILKEKGFTNDFLECCLQRIYNEYKRRV